MLRLLLILGCVPMLLKGQGPTGTITNRQLNNNQEHGGINICVIINAFEAYNRGHTCSDSIKPLYRFVESYDSANQVSASVFTCDEGDLWLTGLNGYSTTWSGSNNSIGGKARKVYSASNKSMAVAGASVQFDHSSHQVILNDLQGKLMAATDGEASATVSYVVWIADEANDTLFDQDDVLWKATATLENGNYFFTGFSAGEFVVTDYTDSMVAEMNNMAKTIQVPAEVDMENVVVQVDGRVYVNEDAGPASMPMGLAEEKEQEVKAYPNPATDVLNVARSGKGTATIELMDIRGEIVRKQEIPAWETAIQLDLASLRAGTYFLRTISDESANLQKVILR